MLSEIDGIFSYDFTTAEDQSHGTNSQKDLEGEAFGMISADANADGDVNVADLRQWENQVGEAGYFSSDFDFNCQTDNSDKNYNLLMNSDENSQVPE